MPTSQMSNAIVTPAIATSPLATTQLYFNWCDGGEPQPVREKAVREKTERAHGRIQQPQSEVPTTSNAPAKQPGVREAERQAAACESSQLSFTADGRIEKPIKIGSVMIKLLKKYGVTDQEIQAGLASYALKHQQSMAS